VIDGMQTGAGGKHPTGEYPPDLAIEGDFINLDKSIRQRRFSRGAIIANAWCHL